MAKSRSEAQQAFLQAAQLASQFADLVAQVEADVGGHLVVARAAGVQFLAHVADALGQARLDVHVHVLEGGGPGELAALDLAADGFQALDDLPALVFGEHAHVGEHARMGDGAGDVVPVETLVEAHRGGEGLHEGIGGGGEAARPGLVDGLLVAHVADRKVRENRRQVYRFCPPGRDS